jgi:hypothetical protein
VGVPYSNIHPISHIGTAIITKSASNRFQLVANWLLDDRGGLRPQCLIQ